MKSPPQKNKKKTILIRKSFSLKNGLPAKRGLALPVADGESAAQPKCWKLIEALGKTQLRRHRRSEKKKKTGAGCTSCFFLKKNPVCVFVGFLFVAVVVRVVCCCFRKGGMVKIRDLKFENHRISMVCTSSSAAPLLLSWFLHLKTLMQSVVCSAWSCLINDLSALNQQAFRDRNSLAGKPRMRTKQHRQSVKSESRHHFGNAGTDNTTLNRNISLQTDSYNSNSRSRKRIFTIPHKPHTYCA